VEAPRPYAHGQSNLRPRLSHHTNKRQQQKVIPENAWNIHEAENQMDATIASSTIITQKGTVRKVPGRNVFAMDAVFEEQNDTKTVYNEMVKPIVLSAATGQHGTVFVYGQTGSGKTFTMQGGDIDPFIGSRPKGFIQMAAADLFSRIEATERRDWVIKASFFEVYNEEVRDLLVPDDNDSLSSTCSHSCLPVLTVREDSSGNVRLKAHEEVVTSLKDVTRVLHKGNAHRACGSTARNSRSSRSHAIFRLYIESRSKHLCDDDSNMVRRSVLNLVDLAGSENSNHSSTLTRRREGSKINQSLLALTRVIQSLGLPEKKRPKHISYRDSKLTRILKQSLQGEACMAIVCCASPCRNDLEETRSTLKFATSAKRIQINPTVNEVSDSAVSKLQGELSALKQALSALQEKYHQRELENARRARVLDNAPNKNVSPRHHITASPPLVSGHFEEVESEGSEISSNSAIEDEVLEQDSKSPPPPVKEVAVVLDSDSHPENYSEVNSRERFLQDKLSASYDVIAGLIQELEQARGFVHQLHNQNQELQDKLSALEEELRDKKSDDSSPVSPWVYGAGLCLYAFENNQFVLAAMLYMWLSQNFAAAQAITVSTVSRKEDDEDEFYDVV
jgi:centromeric protein E